MLKVVMTPHVDGEEGVYEVKLSLGTECEKTKPLQTFPYITVYYEKGVALLHNGQVGGGYCCHPTRDPTGNKTGLIKKGLWHKDAQEVRHHGLIFDISRISMHDPIEYLAKYLEDTHCRELKRNEVTTILIDFYD